MPKLGHPFDNGASEHLMYDMNIYHLWKQKRCVYECFSDAFFRLLCSVRIEHLLRMFDYYEKWALGPRISRFTFCSNFRLIFLSVWLIYKLDSAINLLAWLQLKMYVGAKLWLEMKFDGKMLALKNVRRSLFSQTYNSICCCIFMGKMYCEFSHHLYALSHCGTCVFISIQFNRTHYLRLKWIRFDKQNSIRTEKHNEWYVRSILDA